MARCQTQENSQVGDWEAMPLAPEVIYHVATQPLSLKLCEREAKEEKVTQSPHGEELKVKPNSSVKANPSRPNFVNRKPNLKLSLTFSLRASAWACVWLQLRADNKAHTTSAPVLNCWLD